jgi:hypothetical protein
LATDQVATKSSEVSPTTFEDRVGAKTSSTWGQLKVVKETAGEEAEEEQWF